MLVRLLERGALMLAIYDVLAKFGPHKQHGREYRVRCPAHDDTQPSLDICEGDSSILFQCRSAKCATADILRAAGLTWADVTLPVNGSAPGDWDAEHEYRDANGVHVGTVYRKGSGSGKKIRQKNASGEWKGFPAIPYRLPELYGHKRVFIAEGEKCVDRLWSIGLPATCNLGGAKKWRESDTQFIKAAGVVSVVVLPDNDTEGLAHAGMVATSLTAAGVKALTVTLPGLSQKCDIADWLDTGHTKAELEQLAAKPINGHRPRELRLLPATSVAIRPVKWLWQDRIALGALALIGGREGVGKSLVAYTLAADLSRGRLPGIYAGTPKSVIIVATEDSWAHTIVPRLMAADADLDRIFRIDVHTPEGESLVTLPVDLPELERVIRESDVGLILLDPLLSRLAATLDTHKDSDVRKALEPLVALADATGAAVVGLIHVTKSASTDALTLLMGSRAFAAVARAVLFVMLDPDDQSKRQRLLGQAKNNLGRMDLPTLQFVVGGHHVATTPEGEIWTGKLTWTGESERLISEALISAADTQSGDAPLTADAMDWLREYLEEQGGACNSKTIKSAARSQGHSSRTLQRARERIGIVVVRTGYQAGTLWKLPTPAESTTSDDDNAQF